jgi:hypothetical protein
MAIWHYILWSFGIYCPCFGTLYREKSGNPGWQKAEEKKSNILLSKLKLFDPSLSGIDAKTIFLEVCSQRK